MMKLIAVAGTLAMMTGCGALSAYPCGSIYTNATIPHATDRAEVTGENKTGEKMGEACATGILGVVATGDASIHAAKQAGGITSVHSVELKRFDILGLYTKGCTVVTGS